MHIGLFLTVAISVGATAMSAGEARDLAIVEVQAGKRDRTDTPVVVPASAESLFSRDMSADKLTGLTLSLVPRESVGSAQSIPAQWQTATDPPMQAFKTGALAFILPGKLAAGESRTYTLRLVAGSAPTAGIRVEDDKGKSLLFRSGVRSVAKYNYGLIQKNPGKPSAFDRTAYFHPVWAPCGHIITDDFPKSHKHQRGVFLAWTRATIGKYKADFWNLGVRRGKTRHKGLSSVVSGPVFGGFVARNDCVAEDRVAIEETWVTRVYARPTGPWIIDFDIRHTAVDKRVVLEKYHYGGMAFRGRPDWLKRKRPTIEASDGFNAKKGATESAKWIDMAGELPGGKQGGIVLIDHASNPTYPTAARIHPKDPYFCFAFSRRGAYTIEPGQSLELRYRCVIHDGLPDRKDDDRWAADFADPPKVVVKPIGK